MFHNLEILSVGAAAVLETVLLFAMLERRNGRYVRLWMLLLTAGTWLWHSATFFYMLLSDIRGDIALQLRWGVMIVMTTGLLLIPSAILHGILRLRGRGLNGSDQPQPAYALLYAPLLMVFPIALQLKTNPAARYLELVAPYVGFYLAWICLANSFSAWGAWHLRKTIDLPRANLFFLSLSATLVVTTVLTTCVVGMGSRIPTSELSGLILMLTLFPAIPAILFAYFVIRYRFLPLILERTFVYSAVAAGLLLMHQVLLGDVRNAASEQYHVDFAILEGLAGIALVAAYPPLRARTAEALRYLMGSRVTRVRDQMRQLSVQMSAWAGQPPIDILGCFISTLREPLRVDYVAGWLLTPTEKKIVRAGDYSRVEDSKAIEIYQAMSATGLKWCTLNDVPSREILTLLQEAEASAAALIEHQEIHGLLLLGNHSWHQQLGEEELNLLVLLVDQLGSTLYNSLLLGERLAAERRALQNEKLSTLGLLAGSIAHEVKNPLSSIKTIVTVLSEQLPADGEHAQDLQIILSEVDRLAMTTSQLLEFARPASETSDQGHVHQVVQWTLRVMRHVAHQRNVNIDVDLAQDVPFVTAEENALREIFFNLLSNSIDAMKSGGRIQLACHRQADHVIVEIRDDGPGIPAELQGRLFEPFFTTKETGTGLGLYVVGRRVRESGGEIHCISESGQGTTFILKFPCKSLG